VQTADSDGVDDTKPDAVRSAESTVASTVASAPKQVKTLTDKARSKSGKAEDAQVDAGTAKQAKSYRKSGQLSSKPLSKKVQ
jgi:hypothetical protein